MLIYILMALVVIITIGTIIHVTYEYDHIGEGLAAGAFALLVSIPVSFGVYAFAVAAAPGGEKVAVVTELSALGNDSSLSGSFFLGSGTIDEEQVYQFIAQTEDGGYYLDSVPVDDVLVYTDATPETATYVDYIRMVDNFWLSDRPIQSSDSYTDEFHVPEGSVDFSYRISVTD